jgi:tol-pal system protein YbgF
LEIAVVRFAHLNTTLKTTLLLSLAVSFAIGGCATQKDTTLLNTMEELRREIANMRQLNNPKEESTKAPTRAPESEKPMRPRLKSTPGIHDTTELPIIRLSPNAYNYQRTAPLADALKTPTAQPSRYKSRDILLPQNEVPDLVYQTLDKYGTAYEANGHPITMASPDPTLVDDDIEEEMEEPEITTLNYDTMNSLSTYEPDLESDTITTDTMTATPTETFDESPAPVPEWAVTTSEMEMVNPADNGDPNLLYQWGMDALRTKQYKSAVAAFQAILDRHEEHDLADNSLYWLGEVHYDQNQYGLALSTFQGVLKRYPLGNKVPDAMVKVGLCFKNLGKDHHAKEILEQVITIYPTSHAATVAQARLTSM